MKLVIVESPAKAKTINKYLGSDYKVLASFGHIRDLQRVREDEHDAADEGKGKDHPPRDEPRGGALILFLHPLSPEP